MDFSFNEEQRMLKDMVDRLVNDQYTFEKREGYRKEQNGFSADIWPQFAELGLLGIPFPEDVGGFGGGGAEVMIIGQSFGRGLVVEPYLSSVILSGILIDRLAGDTLKQQLLEKLISGKAKYAFACREPDGGHDHWWVETTAKSSGEGYKLDGRKAVVAHGGSADQLLVVARVTGKPGDSDGLSVFLVDADAEGVSYQCYPTIDGYQAADICLDNVQVGGKALLGNNGQAGPAIQNAMDYGLVYLCSEATGAMEVACDQTLEYIKERKQFGVPIGSFQALQHRMVDMRIALEKVRSLTLWAACTLDADNDTATRNKRVAAAKAMVGKAGRHVAQEAVQLFGGMGMMDETPVSHYVKRIDMLDHWLGDYRWHLTAFQQAANS